MFWGKKNRQDFSAKCFLQPDNDFSETCNEISIADLLVTPLPKLEIPDVPLELLYRPYSFWRGIMSRHTNDLKMIFIALTIFICLVAYYLFGIIKDLNTPAILNSHAISVFTGAAAAWAGVLFTVYQVAKKRLAIVDIINSEIIVIARIFAFTNTVGGIAKLMQAFSTDDAIRVAEILKNSGVGRRVRSESYFEFFHNNPHDLGSLDSDIVDHVTYFYTFFKAARDEANDLASYLHGIIENKEYENAEPSSQYEEVQRILVNLLYLLDVMMLTANRALVKMVRSETHRAYTSQLTLAQGIRANSVLCAHFLKRADGRFYDRRLLQALGRRVVYAKMVGKWEADCRKAPLIKKMEHEIFNVSRH